MSGISGLGDFGLGAMLASESRTAKVQLDTLTQQMASGRVSDSYAGLGAAARVSLDLRPQITASQTWQSNIDAANGRLQVTQSVLGQLHDLASQFYGDALNLNVQMSSGIDSLAAQARSALQQVAGLLNTQDGQTYVLAGEDSANPPVPDAPGILSSSFFTQIQAAVGGLAANGAAATDAATLAIAADPAASPFSPTLGTQPATAEIGPGQRLPVGIIANQNAYAVQTDPESTGSYVTDLMRALATIGSLSDSQAALGQPFLDLVNDTRATLKTAMDAISTDSAGLGARQAQLAAARTGLDQTVTALTAQVTGVEDVDAAATATALSTVQTQLQASYKLIANMNAFSLVDYLPSG